MKVLHMREVDGDRAEVVFHGQVTVIRGLDPLRRAWLLEVLGKLASGDDPAARGEILAHGMSFPLDHASLALLDLDEAVPTVVRAEDLPGHDPRLAEAATARDRALVRRRDLTGQITQQRNALAAAVAERAAAGEAIEELQRGDGEARSAIAAAEAAHARLEAEVASAVEGRARNHQALIAAVQARDLASEAQAGAAERLERALERRRGAMAAATEAAAHLEQARPLVAHDPTDALVAARSALAVAEAAAGEADPDAGSSPASRTLADLERRRVELVRLREAVGDDESRAVSVGLDRLLEAGSEAPPVVAALALADSWRDLHQQIGALDTGVSDEEYAAEQRVVQGRQAVIEAEAEYNQPVLTPEQITKVEAAHAAVLEAQDRSEGRFGGSRLRKKLDEARNEERRVLERLGFSTYADYMMSSSSRGVGPANRTTLENVRLHLKMAEDDLASLPGAADRTRRRVELLQRRDAVSPKVAALLGHEPTGPEAEDELRAMREPVSADEAALDHLAAELESAGVSLGPPPHEREDLVLLARFYLSEQGEAEARRSEIEGSLAALDGAIERTRLAHDRGDHDAPDLSNLPELALPVDAAGVAEAADAPGQARTLREARWAEVAGAQEAVAVAEAEVALHREAAASLARLEGDLAAAGIEEEQAAVAVTEAEAELDLANGPSFDHAVEAVTEAEASVAGSAGREDAARQAIEDFVGDAGLTSLVADAGQRLAVGERAVTEAAAAEQMTAALLAEVDAAFAAATGAEQQALADAGSIDRDQLVEDIEWALMARLAAVRNVGLAGSVPLVLDDPFSVLDEDELTRVLNRVARLADAVQVVLVTDQEAAVAWAAQIGSDRALVHTA